MANTRGSALHRVVIAMQRVLEVPGEPLVLRYLREAKECEELRRTIPEIVYLQPLPGTNEQSMEWAMRYQGDAAASVLRAKRRSHGSSETR